MIPLRTQQQYEQEAIAAMQAYYTALTGANLTPGNNFLALVEALSNVATWNQDNSVQTFLNTRLATSTGANVDSFIADFGLPRLPAVASSGLVTCGNNTDTSTTLIPLGVQFKTTDGTLVFEVVVDTTNTSWNLAANSYLRPAGTPSINVPVQCGTAGSLGNVAAGTITSIASAVAIDYVTNAAAFTSGEDGETDQAVRLRFANYVATRSEATVPAIEYAISQVQSGLTYDIQENVAPDGTARPGNIIIYVDNGSGAPPQSLLDIIYDAVDAVVALGMTLMVFPPTVVLVDIVCNFTAQTGYLATALASPVDTAISVYVGSLGIGNSLGYLDLAGTIKSGVLGLQSVISLTLNGGTSDIGGGATQSVRINSVTLNGALV